jgi:hypothetical protein
MKIYIILILILLLISSCNTLVDNGSEQVIKKNIILEPITRIEKIDYGPVYPQDIENYYIFQTKVICGESHEKLLNQFNWTFNRIYEINQKINQDESSKIIFAKVSETCPEMIEYQEPSIGGVEN